MKWAKKKKARKAIKKTARVTPRRERAAEKERKLQELLGRGHSKGFVSDLEILDYFPRIETDTRFLEQIYERLDKEGLKVVEVESLLGLPSEEISRKELQDATKVRGQLADNVQMYLKEIGKTALLTSAEEKYLSRRFTKGDEQARQRLIKANLRLVWDCHCYIASKIYRPRISLWDYYFRSYGARRRLTEKLCLLL